MCGFRQANSITMPLPRQWRVALKMDMEPAWKVWVTVAVPGLTSTSNGIEPTACCGAAPQQVVTSALQRAP